MRNRFDQNLALGQTPIGHVVIPINTRDREIAILKTLQKIFITPEINTKIFNILAEHIQKGKKKTGRNGMDLWIIFVLAQIRLCLDISYERLHYLANYDELLRQIMGVKTGLGVERIEYAYNTIRDNVLLLNEEVLREINLVIIEMGHKVFNHKKNDPLRLKSDSFVAKNTVHFPTDYNLLWDSGRKCVDVLEQMIEKIPQMQGWRKIENWRSRLKNQMRGLSRALFSGGKNKDLRVRPLAHQYIQTAKKLSKKIKLQVQGISIDGIEIMALLISLGYYQEMLDKHIDLVYRRLILNEVISHHEKIFSIFETYTEWINKGKLHPNVELGKNVVITTDQYHLIIDYKIMEHESDSGVVISMADNILNKFKVESWSYDKGFYSKENKELLKLFILKVIMPKKGKCNEQEKQEENQKEFKKLKNSHSAVESNINELEYNGLNRCPDKGYKHFRRYIGLGICAYNLHRIGKELIAQERLKIEQERIAA